MFHPDSVSAGRSFVCVTFLTGPAALIAAALMASEISSESFSLCIARATDIPPMRTPIIRPGSGSLILVCPARKTLRDKIYDSGHLFFIDGLNLLTEADDFRC